jgi:class 3 adenylate cyclase
MVERNEEVAPGRRIEFRVGIHLGDVVQESDGEWVKSTPKATFKVGPVNGREARESGLQRSRPCVVSASVAHCGKRG